MQLSEVTRLAPRLADVHYGLGVFLADAKRYPEAEAAFREAFHHDPAHAQAHGDLGTVLAQTNRLWEAEAEFRKAIRLDPPSPLRTPISA